MTVHMRIQGDYACFTRPELKVERVSYEIPTPSAIRGVIESVYWHPGISWKVDKIYVLSKIKHIDIRRNEVKSKILASNVRSVMMGGKKELQIETSQDIQQRASKVLKDVDYIVEAHFDITDKAAPGDNPGKFQDITKRRLKKGQCYSQPYLGCREFTARVELFAGEEIVTAYPDETIDLGYMLYDMDYSDKENIQPMFFRAIMKNGVIDLRDCEVLK